MQIKNPAFTAEALKFIYSQAVFHFKQYHVWKRDAMATTAMTTAVQHMQQADTLVCLLEHICTGHHQGGAHGEISWSLQERLESFEPHLGGEKETI